MVLKSLASTPEQQQVLLDALGSFWQHRPQVNGNEREREKKKGGEGEERRRGNETKKERKKEDQGKSDEKDTICISLEYVCG